MEEEEIFEFIQAQLRLGVPAWLIAERLPNAKSLSKQEAEEYVLRIAEQTLKNASKEGIPSKRQQLDSTEIRESIYSEKSLTREIIEIAISSVVLAVGFGIVFSGGVSAFSDSTTLIRMIWLSLIVVSLGFILHEIGHRYVAKKYGFSASFSMWLPGLVIALVVSLSGWIFAAPGAVMIRSKNDNTEVTTKHMGQISIAGPLVNLFLSIIFMLGLSMLITNDNFTTQSNMMFLIFLMGAEINAMFAGLNLLPIMMFDGRKVFRWNKLVWFLAFTASAGLFFMIHTAPSWVDSLAVLGEPKAPVSYALYQDDISGFSFQYPSNWIQNTFEEKMEYISNQDPDIRTDFAIGARSIVYFHDPTHSGILMIRTIDYGKKGQNITFSDLQLSELIDGFVADVKNPISVSKQKTTMGGQATNGVLNAWEINFKEYSEGEIMNHTYIISSEGPLLQYTGFICIEDDINVLWPAYEKFKETFRFD